MFMDRTVYEKNMIEMAFHDDRDLKVVVGLSNVIDERFTGSLFVDSNDEFVYLDYQYSDFTYDDLVKYTEIAESLFSVNHKKVSVYILCFDNVKVLVKEFDIPSEADFVIKLAVSSLNPCSVILDGIKNKLSNGEVLDSDDFKALRLLPLMCDESERSYYRRECFKILAEV